MSPVLDFFKRLFSKETPPEPGSIAKELWIADFSSPEKGRFPAEKAESHAASYEDGALVLDLRRERLYAWTEATLYRYDDFVLEGEFEFAPEAASAAVGALDATGAAGGPASTGPGSAGAAGASGGGAGETEAGSAAAGFLFRYADEGNFYSALVSDRGYFRLDAVFNGKPRPLIAWTRAKEGEKDGRIADFSLRIIARGERLCLEVDGLWVGEAVDDELRSGFVAFAGQNYGASASARLALRSAFVESRPVEVETWYYRHSYFEAVDPGARFRLAETFFSMGEWLKAAVQLRKIERKRPLSPPELFLKAEAALRLELLDEAEQSIEACLASAPAMREAVEEKANLLYLRGRYPELRDYAAGILADAPDNGRLRGLLGHARFNLGDYRGAAEDYGRAAALEPGQPLFRMNEARALDQAGDKAAAAEAYAAAARGFYEAEADDDLALALGRLSALRPRAAETRELKAKALFRAGRKEEARKLIEALLDKGSSDSALHYLAGILASERGDREKALERYSRALELEPAYPLYAFRRAEALFLLGRPEAEEAIARALELAPEEGWTRNLAALAILKSADEGAESLSPELAAKARALLAGARAALPEAPEPAINLAWLESLEGRLDEALSVLAHFPASAAARNEAGNALARAARAAGAAATAEAAGRSGAQAAAPAAATAAGPDGGAAEAAGRSGAQGAAEASSAREDLLERAAKEYEAATALDPGKAEYQTNLAAAYLELERFGDAEERLRRALDLGPEPRAYLLAGNLGAVYGDRIRAEAAYRLGLELAPGDSALLFALGRSYLSGGKSAKAEECRARLADVDAGRAARLGEEILEATTVRTACASCGRVWRSPRVLPAQSAASIRAMPPDDSPAGACPTCGRVFCIACRKGHLAENRFTCPSCGEALKLSDDRLRYLVREHLRRARAGGDAGGVEAAAASGGAEGTGAGDAANGGEGAGGGEGQKA
ncbi:MAG TPA: tetratricopeptide repeat protein [Spirochaetales bacterium]|nr:tetratricopeptide repeat protein [Spirochaetales bacterium]